jgi:hypothetical protein
VGGHALGDRHDLVVDDEDPVVPAGTKLSTTTEPVRLAATATG